MVVVRYRALVAALLSLSVIAQGAPAVQSRPLAQAAVTVAGWNAGSPTRDYSRSAVPVLPRRTPPPVPVVRDLRKNVVKGIHRQGSAVPGFPMLREQDLDRLRKRAAELRSSMHALEPLATSASLPLHSAAPHGVSRPEAMRRLQSLPGNSSASGTGINPWWRYEEESVPGGGKLMVNVGNGNLLFQDSDMSVPHQGIAMAFQRTYNLQSLHDVNGDDGGPPSMYGNGWTNNFDAHLTGTSSALTVSDIDGAQYLYTLASDGVTWVPPVGQHATLISDNQCGFLWTKKSGTSYYFYEPYQLTTCGTRWVQQAGYAGRLREIIGRNSNDRIYLTYYWVSGSSATGTITQIQASTDSNMVATLNIGDVAGHNLLLDLVEPDGSSTVSYAYDNGGNLAAVSRVPNNASGVHPIQDYAYGPMGTGYTLAAIFSPRWYAACAAGACTDGSFIELVLSGSSLSTATLNTIVHDGVVNPTISDGTGSVGLQPGYSTSYFQYLTEYFGTYPGTNGTGTYFQDTDGHATAWTVDALGRPTETQQCTATQGTPPSGITCSGTWIRRFENWDASNNVTSEVDPNGNETDYSYDTNGNATAVAEPADLPGGLRPTRLYSYDAYNNVISYCDQVATNQLGLNWTGTPSQSDDLCPSSVYATRYAYAYSTIEPYGALQTLTTPATATAPSGYTETYTNNNYGLPTSVAGAPFTEPAIATGGTSTTITPQQTFAYDANGNILCYSKMAGAVWVLTYDSMGRVLTIADPDDASSGTTCSRTPGLPNSTLKTTYAYYPDGSKSSEQSPVEAVNGVATSYSYDLDGDETAEVHHYDNTAGTTTKWYDGADRLVETELPHDPTDYYSAPWLTRYLYDLSAGGTSGGFAQAIKAYGGLYEAEEWLPLENSSSTYEWTGTHGTDFDALDRIVSKITEASYGSPSMGTFVSEKEVYDASGQLGLLSSDTDAAGNSTTYSYTNRQLLAKEVFSGSITPTRTYHYDLDGRETDVNSAAFGDDSRTYDYAGELTSRSEPTGAGVNDPATYTYHYFPNGWKSSVDVAAELGGTIPGLGTSAKVYAYRADSELVGEGYNYNGSYYPFTSTLTAAGRTESTSDPYLATSHAYAYDGAGRVTQYATPSIAFSQFAYDDEGEPTSFSGYGSTVTNTYTVRGELVAQKFGFDGCGNTNGFFIWPPAWFQNNSANGVMVRASQCGTNVS
ncbi:MAG: DUF6531 domain-containing protein, partial [Vulcanimicrobiaceae bacterium]